LNIFIDLLRRKNHKIKDYYFANNYIVNNEKYINLGTDTGNIDILIHDKENAIIIENKSKNANDTDNQLSKYYKYVNENMGLNILAVVYIPLYPSKEPYFDNYSDEYLKYVPKIKEVLVCLPIIGKDRETDFVHGFLEKCYSHSVKSGNLNSTILLDQFIKLLKRVGGFNMLTNTDRDAIIEIYADKEKLTKFDLLGFLWKQKDEIIGNLIKEKLMEYGFKEFPNEKDTLYLKIDEYISLGYNLYYRLFGFVYTPGSKGISEEQYWNLKTKLKIMLDNKNCRDIYEEGEIYRNEYWVSKTVVYKKITDFNNIIVNFNILKML